MNSETKICQNCKRDFTIEPDDFSFYEKIKVPPPTFCPECRFIRRLCWRNERSLYKRVCNLCNREIISMYPADAIFPVYCPNCYRSDAWDPFEYRQVLDFSISFFKQFQKLFNQVPRESVWQMGNVINVEYANFVHNVKNVYLSYSVISNSEDVVFSNNIDNSKQIVDSYNIVDSELVYENIGSAKNYNCQYSYWSSSCVDSNFILDCANCSNCFGCVNLRGKKYCMWNVQYAKEEYVNKIKDVNMGSYKFVQKTFVDFKDFSLEFPRKYGRIINCINSGGDELRDCRNLLSSFNCFNSENVKFAYRSPKIKDSMDVNHFHFAELGYEHSTGGFF